LLWNLSPYTTYYFAARSLSSVAKVKYPVDKSSALVKMNWKEKGELAYVYVYTYGDFDIDDYTLILPSDFSFEVRSDWTCLYNLGLTWRILPIVKLKNSYLIFYI